MRGQFHTVHAYCLHLSRINRLLLRKKKQEKVNADTGCGLEKKIKSVKNEFDTRHRLQP